MQRRLCGVWLVACAPARGGQYGPVNWNEGLHSWLRGKLHRLVRRTKGYTKSIVMLVYSIALAYWYARGGRRQFNTSTH